MIDCVELVMSGRNRIIFRRTMQGVAYCELSQPGADEFGHGYLVTDSVFLEPAQAEKLCNLLRPEMAHAPSARPGGDIAPSPWPPAGQCKTR